MNEKIIDNPELIGASSVSDEAGNGNNAILVGKLITSSKSTYQGMIGQLGVNGQQAERLVNNITTLKQAVEERRSSVSSVSLDEEMTNMIKFQHAYNASARNITVVDEMLDKIINGMGRVGL